MTGTELAREVCGRLPGTKVLVISGYAEVDGVAPDLSRLTKPFRPGRPGPQARRAGRTFGGLTGD